MPEHPDTEQYFRYRCKKGLANRGLAGRKEYEERLDYEIKIINEMQYPGYFLIVSDIITWAISVGIPVGPGRGSAGGSLVAYVLEITHVDPIEYKLIFERFLNPDRKSLPDIDMDFCEERRHEVIDYVTDKYGIDRVAHIGTYGSMKAKGAIRDVCRTLGIEYLIGDKLAKLTLPPIEGKPQSLEVCYDKVPELKNIRSGVIQGPEYEVLKWAEKTENRLRSFGTHASGVVISEDPITNNIPLYPGKDGKATTQFEMYTVEECGLIKFDFLGLRALTTISRCVNMISERHGIDIDPLKIPVDDEKVYKQLQNGDIQGVFQLEGSSGIRDLLVQIRPTNLEDIAVLVALYRPGPLGCLSGDTQILTGIINGYSKNGSPKRNFRYTTIRELYDSYQHKQSGQARHRKVAIWSVDEDQNILVQNKINTVYASGQQEVFRINIQTGISKTQKNYVPSLNHSQRKTNQIKATKDHRFLTLDGWKRLEDISIGEYIGIAHHSCFGVQRSKKNVYGKKNFANIAFRHYQYRCVFCDWNEGSLDVNHIEGNRNTNNSPENLSFLCPNHHRMYNEGTISKDELIKEREQYSLPYTKQIMFVKFLGKESCGIEETFDISVEDPHHNFLAGDFVVHNSDMLQHYLKVRAGQASADFLVPELKPILGPTDGMLIYQEQILEICKQLAGYTMGEADLMRRAVGKKKQKLMDIEHPKFLKGMQDHGFELSVAENIWKDIDVFAGYGFNKSHAVCYAFISYQMAYLKTYYPLEFMCACLIGDADEVEKVIKYISYCKSVGTEILPPSINDSEYTFNISGDGKSIRFGLSAIKNLGAPVQLIIDERKENGVFIDIIDFANRVDLGKINKRKLESLVMSGAFDDAGHNRASLMGAIEDLYRYKKEKKSYDAKLDTFYKRTEKFEERQAAIAEYEKLNHTERKGKKKPGKMKLPVKPEEPTSPSIPTLPNLSKQECLSQEKELLGYYVSGHPLDDIKEWSRGSIASIKDSLQGNRKEVLIAIPSVMKEITTKKRKQKMAYMVLEDKTGTIEAVILPKPYAQYHQLVDTTRPARYEVFVDVIEADTHRITKLRILSVSPLTMIHQELKRLNLTVPLDQAKEATQTIKLMSGKEFEIDLNIKSEQNIWRLGTFQCKGSMTRLAKFQG